MGSSGATRRLARQQRRHRRQDLYGQSATNMSLGDHIAKWVYEDSPAARQLPAADWYQCATDPIGVARYWDGIQWTGWVKP